MSSPLVISTTTGVLTPAASQHCREQFGLRAHTQLYRALKVSHTEHEHVTACGDALKLFFRLKKGGKVQSKGIVSVSSGSPISSLASLRAVSSRFRSLRSIRPPAVDYFDQPANEYTSTQTKTHADKHLHRRTGGQ